MMMNPLFLLINLLSVFVGLALVGWIFFCRSEKDLVTAEPARPALEETLAIDDQVVFPTPDVSAPVEKSSRNWFLILRWPAFAVLLVLLTIAATLSMAGRRTLDPLDVQQFSGQGHIRMALVKEDLLPPAPLPPTLFVDQDRPGLAQADRDWNKLDPVFMRQVLVVFHQMRKRGYPLALLEAYRSPERQDRLAAKGSHVTHAKGNQSRHQYGLAVDVAFIRDGKLVISERDSWAAEGYRVLGEEVEAQGMTWGGRWSFRDYGHFEMTGSLSALLKQQAERSGK